jgi:primosomal protein N' (replication factor Y)
LLAQSDSSGKLHDWLRLWFLAAPKERGSVRVSVDVDPISFL